MLRKYLKKKKKLKYGFDAYRYVIFQVQIQERDKPRTQKKQQK